MKNYQNIILVFICVVGLTACDKYLDVEPKGKTLLNTTTDYDLWLNDPQLNYGPEPPYGDLNFLGDNEDMPSISTPQVSLLEFIYTWAPQFTNDLVTPAHFWGFHYANINKFNTVLVGIDDATGTINERNSLKAEALLGRAFEYFYLVNEYGKPYDSSTVNQDLAVPFVTSNDVSQTVPARSTISEIYDHIINDINEAIPYLPQTNIANRFRGSKAAAYSVLARVYFYARNYTEARKYAQMTLDLSSATMIDYNGAFTTPASSSIQPDVIYGRIGVGYAIPTLEFLRSFASNDRRLPLLYYSLDGYTFANRGGTYFYPGLRTAYFTNVNTGTSVQEMKLIIAEVAARNNELSVALEQLDDIRKNRFPAASYVPFSSTDQTEVYDEVMLERKHELPFSGLRWFDMRRLDSENRMDTVKRYDGAGNVIATLPPHSDRYTFQIPLQVLKYNPGMKQNP